MRSRTRSHLSCRAIEHGSRDNVTVMVMDVAGYMTSPTRRPPGQPVWETAVQEEADVTHAAAATADDLPAAFSGAEVNGPGEVEESEEKTKQTSAVPIVGVATQAILFRNLPTFITAPP